MAGLWDTLIEGGLSLYDKYKGRENMPINERVFIETALDKNKEPITEKNLTKTELKQLYDLIYNQYSRYSEGLTKYKEYINTQLKNEKNLIPDFRNQFKKDLVALNDFENKKITPALVNFMTGERSAFTSDGILEATGKVSSIPKLNSYVTYDDYITEQGKAERSLKSSNTAEGSLATFLGRFNYGIDPKTNNLYVKDTYDFNPIYNKYALKQGEEPTYLDAAERSGSMPYNILRAYGERNIPRGAGREVLINLNYQDPFGDTIK